MPEKESEISKVELRHYAIAVALIATVLFMILRQPRPLNAKAFLEGFILELLAGIVLPLLFAVLVFAVRSFILAVKRGTCRNGLNRARTVILTCGQRFLKWLDQ